MTDDEHILLCAVRYSLGRQTYIVTDCVRWVRERWPSLGEDCRVLIFRYVSTEVNKVNPPLSVVHVRSPWSDLVVWMTAHRQECEIDETVTVPRDALQFVMDNGRFEDEGPVWMTTIPEGWKSDEMQRAIDILEKALKG